MTTADDNKNLVREAFQPCEQGNWRPFFDLIVDDVTWTVIGSTPASGVFHSKQAVMDQAFGPLLGLLEGPLKTRFIDVAADGEKVFLRFEGKGVAKSGLHYDQAYCWAMVMRDGRITEIVAYLDTDLLSRIFS